MRVRRRIAVRACTTAARARCAAPLARRTSCVCMVWRARNNPRASLWRTITLANQCIRRQHARNTRSTLTPPPPQRTAVLRDGGGRRLRPGAVQAVVAHGAVGVGGRGDLRGGARHHGGRSQRCQHEAGAASERSVAVRHAPRRRQRLSAGSSAAIHGGAHNE